MKASELERQSPNLTYLRKANKYITNVINLDYKTIQNFRECGAEWCHIYKKCKSELFHRFLFHTVPSFL